MVALDFATFGDDPDAIFRRMCGIMYGDGSISYSEFEDYTERFTGRAGKVPTIEQVEWFHEGVGQIWNEVADKI